MGIGSHTGLRRLQKGAKRILGSLRVVLQIEQDRCRIERVGAVMRVMAEGKLCLLGRAVGLLAVAIKVRQIDVGFGRMGHGQFGGKLRLGGLIVLCFRGDHAGQPVCPGGR